MIGYYNKSVIATYLGLATAIFGISLAMTGRIQHALFCLMVCGLCDMVDGPIARKCARGEDEKSFGIQIDSLVDVVCFGVLPAVICIAIDGGRRYSLIVSAYYALAAVIRLGYFNVQEMNRVRTDPGRRKMYDGLPVTSAALLVPFFAAIDALTPVSFGGFYAVPVAIIGILFISPFRIPKLQTRGMVVCAIVGALIFAVIATLGGRLDIL